MTRKLLILFTLVLGLSSCAASRFQARAPKTPPADLSAPVFDSIGTQYRPLARFFASQGASLPATGNGFSIYTSGRTMFAAMLRDLENARYSIDFMTYRFADDTIATIVRDVLVRKAREGVSVRVILESRSNPYNPSFYKGFQGVPGLQVIRTQPSHNPFSMIFNLFWRDHRKLAVIDGAIGYLGGMNIQDKYHTEWRDTHSRVTGRVASSYSALFQHAWETFSGPAVTPVQTPPAPAGGDAVMQIVGDGPDSAEPVIRKGLELALSQAKEYFYIQNPYFCPPESTIQALLDAAARGVDVRIMFPKGQDVLIMLWVNHSFYKRLPRGASASSSAAGILSTAKPSSQTTICPASHRPIWTIAASTSTSRVICMCTIRPLRCSAVRSSRQICSCAGKLPWKTSTGASRSVICKAFSGWRRFNFSRRPVHCGTKVEAVAVPVINLKRHEKILICSSHRLPGPFYFL